MAVQAVLPNLFQTGADLRQPARRTALTISQFATAFWFSAFPVLAQTAPQLPQLQPVAPAAPGVPAAPEASAAPTSDAITNERIKLLQESGLIDKQSKLSEGLLLMDRQLRQAQLVGQLLSVLGPDAAIEVEPGEFKTFSDTPAGLREKIAYLQLQLQLRDAQEALLGEQTTVANSAPVISEIYGEGKNIRAVLSLSNKKYDVRVGDRVADSAEVLSISPEEVTLQLQDGTIESLKTP